MTGRASRGKQRRDKTGPDISHWLALAGLTLKLLKPVLPSAIGRNGNKVSQNTTQAERGGYGRDLCM